MKHRPTSRRRRTTKSVLRLLDLEHAKSAVLTSLSSLDAQRGYRHAIDEFVDWYCSEPRLAFNRTVVLRYRSHLESRSLAPRAVNLRLGAVRRLAYEAADCGLLSADLAAGIRRVKGVEETRHSPGQLADCGTGTSALASSRSPAAQRKARPRYAGSHARVWIEKTRSRGTNLGSSSAAGRTLGHRGFGRQRRPRPNSSGSRLGKD